MGVRSGSVGVPAHPAGMTWRMPDRAYAADAEGVRRVTARTMTGDARTGRTSRQRGGAKTNSARAGRDGSRYAAERAVAANTIQPTLPFLGRTSLPTPEHLAWYAGVATLTVVGLLEWPVALVITAGHLLGQDHHNRLIEDFGTALEQA
jgi:hypothetical protein